MDWIAILGVAVITVAVTGVLYGIDVRLVLFPGGTDSRSHRQ